MKYAKILSPTSISTTPPKSAIINGKLIIGQLPKDYLASIQFYPYEEQPQPDVQEGYHLEPRYEHIEGKTVKTWTEVQDTPIVEPTNLYSKLKILLASQQAGFDDELIAFFDAEPKVKMIWDASNVIEDNELLEKYLPIIGQALNKTPEEIKTFLNENCVVD